MKFTELRFLEAEAYNTTEFYNPKKLDVPLTDIELIAKGDMRPTDKDGIPITKITPEDIQALGENGIITISDYEHAYNKGNIEAILTNKKSAKRMREIIHYSIDKSIANLPGMKREVYDYLKSKGIKTIDAFKSMHDEMAFTDESLEGTNVNTNDIENVCILVERKNNPSLLRVYHSSADINCAEYIFNKSWADGPNSQAYGTGLYTVWSKASAFDDQSVVYGDKNATPKDFYRDNAIRQGREYYVDNETGGKINFRFEFLVDVQDYFIGCWGLFKQTHPDAKFPDGREVTERNFIEYQNQRFGMNVPTNGSRYAVQEYFWGFWWKNSDGNGWKHGHTNPHFVSESNDGFIKEKDGPCVKGIAFVGTNDGDVVVVYDTKRALPIRVSKGDKNKWFYIGGPGVITTASNLLKMDINASSGRLMDFWKKLEENYRKSIEAMFDTHPGIWDMDETEFIRSNGKNVIIQDSLDDDVIEGPEASEANNQGVFDNYKIIDCVNANAYHIPLTEVKNLEIDNYKDAKCNLITSLAANAELTIHNKAEIYNCPNARMPWKTFYNDNFQGKLKIVNTSLLPDTLIQGFDQAILEDIKTNNGLYFVDCASGTDKGKVSVINIELPEISVGFNEINSMKCLKIIGNSKIGTLNIYSHGDADKCIDTLIISKSALSSGFDVHFEVETDTPQTIYKKDNVVIKHTYSINELIDILKENSDDKSELFEQLEFKINHIEVI